MESPIALPAPANGSKLRPMVGAVVYIRVSTKEQTENLSLSTQLKACEEYCERQGFEVLERFREEDESAKIAGLHFHDLRHEAGSRKLEAGWPLHAVSRWLGHTKLTATDTYLNATTQLLHELNERRPLALVRS